MAQIKTWDNKIISVTLPANVLADHLLALPALIDTHVHFRVPGWEYKEDWQTGTKAAIAGGYTTVIDMPSGIPSTSSYEKLLEKKNKIDEQLKSVEIPLHYKLYFGATPSNLEEIKKASDEIAGIKIYMGSSIGDLVVSKSNDQEKIFKLAAELGLIVAVHAEDEEIINQQKLKISNPTVADHSIIRPREAAIRAVSQAIKLAKKYRTKLYILHLSTKQEVELVREAKHAGIKVYAEVTPHHLFLNTTAYEKLETRAQMNPPLRTPEDQVALWVGINDGTIDCLGTDHAPHTLDEKALPYPKSPSGVPGIETALPLLLNAYHNKKITLEKIVELTSANSRQIFNLPKNNDLVLVDLACTKTVENAKLKTKCGWSPFAGTTLTGWPIYTILNGKFYRS